jgi:putative Holliday junction resolvase
MRVLALDYGSARCGCAVSDPTGTIVTPLEHVERPGTRRGMLALVQLVREREAERVVVGLPLSRAGGEDVPVELHDERFTTRMAQRLDGDASTSEDSRAAAHMLESWMAAQPH